MKKSKLLQGIDRTQLLDELYWKYTKAASPHQRFLYYRKRFLWLFIVGGTSILKRVVDLFASIVLIVLLSPLFLLISTAIKLYDKGPVLYIADRVGRWGEEFRFLKFRTMVVNAEKKKTQLQVEGEVRFKRRKDPRITPIGVFLRKTSIDELPQLLNVLKGEMSLVGPRPPLPEEVAMYTIEQRRRLDVKPGITCIWQVSGRSDIPFPKQVELDHEYIQSQSIWVDIKLLLKTIPAVLFGRGAY